MEIFSFMGGVLAGALIGIALRKAAKLVLIAVGAFLLLLWVLEQTGFVTVNWSMAISVSQDWLNKLMSFISQFPNGGGEVQTGALLGLLAGFVIGGKV